MKSKLFNILSKIRKFLSFFFYSTIILNLILYIRLEVIQIKRFITRKRYNIRIVKILVFLIIVCISIGLTIKLMKISNDKIANNLFSNSLNYSNDLDFLDIINFNLKRQESNI